MVWSELPYRQSQLLLYNRPTYAVKLTSSWTTDPSLHLTQYLLEQIRRGEDSQPIPDLLNQTFHIVDGELSKLAASGGTHSGCTAVTAFLRLEDENGNAADVPASETGGSIGSTVAQGGAAGADESAQSTEEAEKRRFGDGSHRDRIKSFFGASGSSSSSAGSVSTQSVDRQQQASTVITERDASSGKAPVVPKNWSKRTLYTANVGDARAVLWYVPPWIPHNDDARI